MPKSRPPTGRLEMSRPAWWIVPAVWTSSPEIARSSVVLPQPEGPEERDELAALDVEVDIVERGEVPEPLARRPRICR